MSKERTTKKTKTEKVPLSDMSAAERAQSPATTADMKSLKKQMAALTERISKLEEIVDAKVLNARYSRF